MRLHPKEIRTIKSAILNHISATKIMLFGSRVYDDKRGGDINIFVETGSESSLEEKIFILTEIEIRGIQRKIDLIVKTPQSKHLLIYDTIENEGIVL